MTRPPLATTDLEAALKDLSRTGTLIKDRPYRQIWRFTSSDKSYFLKFYPREGKAIKRALRGDPALREFNRLRWLQAAQIPSPRAVAVLKGFRLQDRIGDAVITEAIENAVQLDELLHTHELAGRSLAHRHQLIHRVIELLHQLAAAKLGHNDLHLGNLLVQSNGSVFLMDAYAVHRGGLRYSDLLLLAHSAKRYATRTEILRAWNELGTPLTKIPATNSLSPRLWKKQSNRATHSNRYFAKITHPGGWDGYSFRLCKFPFAWSSASQRVISPEEWTAALTDLLPRLESRDITYLKQSGSADVAAITLILGGQPLDVVIKIPRRKQSHRYLTDILRGDRALRAWQRAWELLARGIPTAWPLLVLRRRSLGYPLESLVIFERVKGRPLSTVDLLSLSSESRDALFRRSGHILRQLDDSGYYHRDAKSDNIMVDQNLQPLFVDLDGIRTPTFGRWSLPRLLTSMKRHPDYSPADSFSLCRGYAPYANIQPERP